MKSTATADAAMFGLAHRAVLLAPTEDALDQTPRQRICASLRCLV
jgi:hypothetical protein